MVLEGGPGRLEKRTSRVGGIDLRSMAKAKPWPAAAPRRCPSSTGGGASAADPPCPCIIGPPFPSRTPSQNHSKIRSKSPSPWYGGILGQNHQKICIMSTGRFENYQGPSWGTAGKRLALMQGGQKWRNGLPMMLMMRPASSASLGSRFSFCQVSRLPGFGVHCPGQTLLNVHVAWYLDAFCPCCHYFCGSEARPMRETWLLLAADLKKCNRGLEHGQPAQRTMSTVIIDGFP